MIRKLLIAAVMLSACATAGSGDTPDVDTGASGAGDVVTETTAPADVGTPAATDRASAGESGSAVPPEPGSTTTVADGAKPDEDRVEQQPEQSQSTTRPDQEPPGEAVPAETETPSKGEVPADVMASIYAAAEAHSGLARSSMTVVRAEAVVWPDGSLGCPEPGMMYTMATVDGYWVELSAGDTTLDYRVGSNGYVKLCESGLGITPPEN